MHREGEILRRSPHLDQHRRLGDQFARIVSHDANAKDALGNDVVISEWLKTHLVGYRALVQGLKGDATYLIVNDAKEIENYALNAVCTHLGCVVPWNKAENKFKCPCHGSQYDKRGKVVRGPAPLSLALAHVEFTGENKEVLLKTWTETDFRTNTAPWWK